MSKISRSSSALVGVLISASALGIPNVSYAENQRAADNGFLTIIWARSNWQAVAGGCEPIAGKTRTLQENAEDLARFKDGKGNGLKGVGGVVVNRTEETGHPFFRGYTLQASWDDMNRLKHVYGWRFISQRMNYENMAKMGEDVEKIRHESLATLPILRQRGHDRAWGAFNYPNNKYKNATAQRIVATKFAFGRVYGNGRNTKPKVTTAPYRMSAMSVNGGRCHNSDLPCYTMRMPGRPGEPGNEHLRSTDVNKMAEVMSPGAGQWGVIQFYRLVQGKHGKIGDGFAWDCTSGDWRNRWTSQPELTCRESFLDALKKRNGLAENADPATVAEAWGVTLPR